MVKEYKEEYELWEKCFGDSEEYMDYYFTEKTKDNKILKIFKENELVSMVHLNPYEIFWKGKVQTLYYIVGVCTDENHRKKGYMRKLLKESFRRMEEEGCPFVYLMPAKKEIYEPFDFQFIYTQKRLRGRLAAAELKAAGLNAADPGDTEIQAAEMAVAGVSSTGSMELIPYRELSEVEKEKAAAFQNEKLSENVDLYAVRNRDYLERLSLEMAAAGGELLIAVDNDRTIRGTVAYMAEKKETSGICEVAEGILSPEDTEDIVDLLEKRLLQGGQLWEIHFLETAFWEEELLSDLLLEPVFTEKPIIMAKVLGEEAGKDTLMEELKKARVYLNEIV